MIERSGLMLVLLRYFVTMAMGVSFVSAAFAKDIPVKNADEVVQALLAAQGGDRILLAPGLYHAIAIDGRNSGSFNFTSPVELRPQIASDKPVIEKLTVLGASNLTFDSLVFDYTYTANDIAGLRVNTVQQSDNIKFTDCVFDGDVASDTGTFADGFATGIALTVTKSKSFTLENSRFFNWLRGGVFSFNRGMVIRKNEVTQLRSDGFDFAAVSDVLIEDNHMHDFATAPGSKDHWDMIQFWTNQTDSPTTDVLIRNNFLDSGVGAGTQSIFMRNEEVDHGRKGDEMLYRNIRIEGNLIRNALSNAIVVGGANGVTITQNTLLQAVTVAEGGRVSVPAIRVTMPAMNVSITDNIYPAEPKLFKTPPEGWRISGNVVAQRENSNAPNYYGLNYVNALASKTMRRQDLALLPDSIWAGQAVGSPLSKFNSSPEEPMGIVQISRGAGSILNQDYKLAGAFGPHGPIDLSSAKITWYFGDGNTGVGLAVSHVYKVAGLYKITLIAEVSGSRVLTEERKILVGYSATQK